MTETGNLMQPLAAVTPPRHMAHLVASRSYLSYDALELQDKLKHNPYSYIQVINPDTSRDVKVPRGTTAFFEEVRHGYLHFKSQGWLEEASQTEWYVYRQSTAAHSWTGVVCNLDLALCAHGRLKTHEKTLESRETLFATFLETVGFHAEPILCALPDDVSFASEADALMKDVVAGTSHTDFMTSDGIRHEIWRIPAEGTLGKRMAQTWGAHSTLYLADGHHRLASSQRLAQARPDLEGAGQILAFVVPEKDLTILGFHKEVSHIDMDVEAFESALNRIHACRVEAAVPEEASPLAAGEVVVHFQGQAWRLNRDAASPEATDADFVDVHLLKGVMDIQDARNNPKLKHLPEPSRPAQGWSSRAAAHPDRVLILLPPLPFEHIRNVADQGNTLPPKSTWVEPKIRSAMFIHEFQTR